MATKPRQRHNRAPQPITRGKPGSMKRALYKAGAGKKVLRDLRTADKTVRKNIAKGTLKLNQIQGIAKGYRIRNTNRRAAAKKKPMRSSKGGGTGGGGRTSRI